MAKERNRRDSQGKEIFRSAMKDTSNASSAPTDIGLEDPPPKPAIPFPQPKPCYGSAKVQESNHFRTVCSESTNSSKMSAVSHRRDSLAPPSRSSSSSPGMGGADELNRSTSGYDASTSAKRNSFARIQEGWYPPRSDKNVPTNNSTGPLFGKAMVSKKKIRIRTEDGYDLDMAYITKNIIAMGYPANGLDGFFIRNHFRDVKSYLESRHGKKYKLWNLCIERKYDHSIYDNRVELFPFLDHNPPPLDYFLPFCISIDQWLDQDNENVAAIHCKAGKGRTGVMIIAYLIYKYHMTFSEGLQYYGKMRTKDLKGVTLPSQKRFIRYFGHVSRKTGPALTSQGAIKNQVVYLNKIKIFSPAIWMGSGRANGLQIKIWDNYWFKPITYKLKGCTRAQVLRTGKSSNRSQVTTYEYELPGDGIPLSREVKIEFFKCGHALSKKHEKFRLWFHASFLPADYISKFGKDDLDDCHKDPKHKKYNSKFMIQLEFRPTPKVPGKPRCMKGKLETAPILNLATRVCVPLPVPAKQDKERLPPPPVPPHSAAADDCLDL